MISLAEAQSLILNEVNLLDTVSLPVSRTLGHALQRALIATTDSPSFDNSAVDGYALTLFDLSNAHRAGLKLDQTIHAGEVTRKKLQRGKTYKIMTGAFVPKGVEAIVIREHTEEKEGRVTCARSIVVGQNIRRRASEFKKGEKLLERGTLIAAPVLGLLASQSVTQLSVIRKPSVGILITGDELTSDGAKASLAQVNDSNSPMLKAMCTRLGIRIVKIIVAKDKAPQIRRAIDRLLDNDILIAVGGVSVGDRDLVKDQLELAGVKRIFWGIDMKPGKPNYFGTRKNGSQKTLVFGLPGNPVSAAVSFKKLIEPAIWKMQGVVQEPIGLFATLTESIRPDKSRLEFARGRITTKEGALIVTPVRGQGSGMLGGLAMANVLIRLLPGEAAIAKGTSVEVELLNW